MVSVGSALERQAIRRVVEQLAAAGVTLPPDLDRAVTSVLCGGGNIGARLWAAAHPDDDRPPCCWASMHDPERCSCWQPVYDVDQAPPRPPNRPEDLHARPRMCGDCAYRPGSPERSDPLLVDELLDLPAGHTPFWCHDGMRRPIRWEHPDGRTIAGDPADWHPAMHSGIPYQADGSPAMLCAGWAALAAKAAEVDDG